MQLNKRPLCSVIVPAHNAAGTIERAIRSIQSQSFEDLEIHVVDDGSTDYTAALVQGMQNDPRLKLKILPETQGPAIARNTALAAARGRYIAFLDADDLWLPGKLDRQLALMRETGAELSYTGYLRRSTWGDAHVYVPAEITRTTLLRGNVIGCLTAIYDAEHLGKIPMRNIRLRQDYALWLDILRLIPRAVGLPDVLAIHNRSWHSLSSDMLANAKGTYGVLRGAGSLPKAKAAWCLGAHYLNRTRMIRAYPHRPATPRIYGRS